MTPHGSIIIINIRNYINFEHSKSKNQTPFYIITEQNPLTKV